MKRITNKFTQVTSRFSAILVMLAVSCAATFAQTDEPEWQDKVYIDNFVIAQKQTKTVEIKLTNADPVSALQFYIDTPSGLTIETSSLSKVTDRITRESHNVLIVDKTWEAQINGEISSNESRYLVGVTPKSTATATEIIGNSGSILSLSFKADHTFKGDDILIHKVIASDGTKSPAQEMRLEDTTCFAQLPAGAVGFDSEEYMIAKGYAAPIPVQLDTNNSLIGLSLLVTLPEGIELVEGEEVLPGEIMTGNMEVDAVEGAPNQYRITISSEIEDVFKNVEGAAFYLNTYAPKSTIGEIAISDVTVTSNYNREFIIEDITTTEVIAYVGDPSGDDVWNVLDLNVIANAILEGADDVIYDLNEDGYVNVLDYNMVVNTLLAE